MTLSRSVALESPEGTVDQRTIVAQRSEVESRKKKRKRCGGPEITLDGASKQMRSRPTWPIVTNGATRFGNGHEVEETI
jgi:hypothetical protein